MRARKRFGQHFLTDPAVIDAIVDAVAPAPTDTLVEIGPGRGAITGPLARRAAKLHAVELDRDLAGRLRRRFAGDERLTLHEADALQFDFSALGESLRLVGNLPYNISTPLLFHVLTHRRAIRDMHFMLQKEVVDRIAAQPGSKAFGRLTIMLQCALSAAKLFDVPPGAFDPPPAVTSAVVRLEPLPVVAVHDMTRLSRIVATAFSQRRKTLRNALAAVAPADALEALGIDAGLRPENLGVDDWVRLANELPADTDSRGGTR